MDTSNDIPGTWTSGPEFSVLITCHYEEQTIDEFFRRLKAAWDATGRSYEIIMINDGSKDGTWERLKSLWQAHPEVSVVVDFFKNGGQMAAQTAAVREARGRHFFLIDSDLQLLPEEIPTLLAVFDEGFDVVSGSRRNRKDSLFRIIPSALANMIMRKASNSDFRDFGCTFKFFHGNLVRSFNFGPSRLFSMVDLISGAGRCREVPVTHLPRQHGKSGWTFRKLWNYNMDNIMKLSQRPFQFLAAACAVLAGLFVVRILAGFFLPFGVLSEVTNGLILNALVIVLLVLLMVLSVLGEFTLRSFLMLRAAPGYAIRERLSREPARVMPSERT